MATKKKVNNDKLKNIRERVYNKALIFLSVKPRAENELRARINYYLYKYKSLSSTEKKDILESLLQDFDGQKLINDARYAEQLVQEKINSRKPQSKLQIRTFLMKKGVSTSVIDAALEEVTTDIEKEKIEQLAKKRLSLMKNEKENMKKRKLISFITKKGYPYDLTRAVVDTIINVK